MNDEDKRTLIEIVTPQSNLLSPGDLTDCEGLFPPEFWAACSRGARTTYGHWIARLVAENALPLEPCGYTSKRHNQYRRI